MLHWLRGLFKTTGGSAPGPAGADPGGEDEAPPPIPFLRREPLLDRSQQVAAYAFSVETPAALRGHAWTGASRKFFDDVLIGHFATDKLAQSLGKRLAFLPLGPAGLASPKLDKLPRENLVIEFAPPDEVEFDTATVAAGLADLRQTGFQLAAGAGLARRGLAEVLGQVHFIDLGDVARESPADLLARCKQLTADYPETRLVARHVDSIELYQACRQMGIQLFQGPFLTRRELNPANKITPYRVCVMQLLNGIKRQADYAELAGIAWRDPALAYRLLRFVNSAAFGLKVKIERLRNALVYVGRDELYRWLTLLLFNSKKPDQLDEALRENALVRAKLAELLAQGRVTPKEADEVFVVGILSVIDALLEMPMQDALAQLNLPEAVTEALLHRRGKYAPYLRLAIACEESDQTTLDTLAAQCDLDAEMVNRRHVDALAWAMRFNEDLEDSLIN